MKYFGYTESGDFNGFYSDDMHGDNIPSPNVQITDDLWLELLTGNYKPNMQLLDTTRVLGFEDIGMFVEVPPVTIPVEKTQLEILQETVDTLLLSML